MNPTDAAAEVQRLLGEAASQLSDADIDAALLRAHVPDPAGLLPGQEGYRPTVEPYWAAAEAATMLGIRAMGGGGLTQFSSEGATFTREQGNFFGMAEALRSMSPLWRLLHGSLDVIEVDIPTGYETTAQSWPDDVRRNLDWT